MSTSAYTQCSSRKAQIRSALLFALAVMLLLVNCPLKRVLQNNYGEYAASATRTNQTNINQRTNADYRAAESCSAIQKKTAFVSSNSFQKEHLTAPFDVLNVTHATGFYINYYLSSIRSKPAASNISTPYSLPLFLQHLRLLI